MTPQRPAAAKSSSAFLSPVWRRRGAAIHSAAYPIKKRKNRISSGVKDTSRTLVEIKVVPQMKMVTAAARWPVMFDFSDICLFLRAGGGVPAGFCKYFLILLRSQPCEILKKTGEMTLVGETGPGGRIDGRYRLFQQLLRLF